MPAKIAKYALLPFIQCPAPYCSDMLALVEAVIEKKGNVEKVAFHAWVNEGKSNVYSIDISSYPVGAKINVKFYLRFLSYSGCRTYTAVNSASGGPPLSLPVKNGHLVFVSCRAPVKGKCELRTDGGSKLELLIVDADGDGIGNATAAVVIEGDGTLILDGVYDQAWMYDVGVSDLPPGTFTMEVEEVPVSNVYTPVYSHEIVCAIIQAPPPTT